MSLGLEQAIPLENPCWLTLRQLLNAFSPGYRIDDHDRPAPRRLIEDPPRRLATIPDIAREPA